MTILYVDDEPMLRRAVELWLSRYGVLVIGASSLVEARELLAAIRVDGIFLDVKLADGSGLELFDTLRSERPTLAEHVAFVTGALPADSRLEGRMADSGCPVVRKPFDLDLLRQIAERWARNRDGDRVRQGGAARPISRR